MLEIDRRIGRPSPHNITAMDDSQLTKLAATLGIDIAASTSPTPTVEDGLATISWSKKPPRFQGAVEFDLQIRALGSITTHRARALYKANSEGKPAGPNGHIRATEQGSSAVGLQLLIWDALDEYGEHDPFADRMPAPCWVKFDPNLAGLLSADLWKQVYQSIDDAIAAEDKGVGHQGDNAPLPNL